MCISKVIQVDLPFLNIDSCALAICIISKSICRIEMVATIDIIHLIEENSTLMFDIYSDQEFLC